jgi:hypothetical protein
VRPARLAALALGAALAGILAGAAAQQPAKKQPPAPAQKSKPVAQSTVYYDMYEASRRLPTRGAICQPGAENRLGAFCVKACKTGYDPRDDARTATRHCRSRKPLPPGVLPTSGQKELAAKPTPPKTKPAKVSPGV